MVRPLGFEPRTNGLRVHCSAVELEAHEIGQANGETVCLANHMTGVSEGN